MLARVLLVMAWSLSASVGWAVCTHTSGEYDTCAEAAECGEEQCEFNRTHGNVGTTCRTFSVFAQIINRNGIDHQHIVYTGECVSPRSNGTPSSCVANRSCYVPMATRPPSINPNNNPDYPAQRCGSVIDVDSLTLREEIPLQGTPFSLVYNSDRQKSRKIDYTINMPIFGGDSTRVLMVSRGVLVKIAGQIYEQNFVQAQDPRVELNYVWNGLDSNGVSINGSRVAQVTYNTVWQESSGIGAPTSITYPFVIGTYQAKVRGLGGWTITPMHFYDIERKKLYLGDGSVRSVDKKDNADGSFWTASSDGSEIYNFANNGRHMSTVDGFFGHTLYTFTYDAQGRLLTIKDKNDKITQIVRVSGVAQKIIAPFGQTTTLTMNSSGMLTGVTNANAEAYSMTYSANGAGLLNKFTNPVGKISAFTYDTEGRLTKDSNNSGYSNTLTMTKLTSGSSVSVTTALNRKSTYVVKNDPQTPAYIREETRPDFSRVTVNHQPLVKENVPGQYVLQDQDYNLRYNFNNDVRFKALASFTSQKTEMNVTTSNVQNLVAPVVPPTDPLNYTSLETVSTTNARINRQLVTKATREEVLTSPEGRVTKIIYDVKGNIASQQFASFLPTTYTYNTDGKLTQIAQGARTTAFTYNAKGLVNKITNSLSQAVTLAYNAADRITTQTLADTNKITLSYDKIGRLTQLQTPKLQNHKTTWAFMDLLSSFIPPVIASVSDVVKFQYDADSKISSMILPSGSTVSYTYGTTSGQLEKITFPDGINQYTYSDGILQSAIAASGIKETYSYRGKYLPNSTNVEFNPSAKVVLAFNYDTNMWLKSMVLTDQVRSQTFTDNYAFDKDGLVIEAGDLDITRQLETGAISASSVGSIVSTNTYNANFGELASVNYKKGTSTLFSSTLTRDSLGRITKNVEIVQGTTRTYDYEYDNRGRLKNVKTGGTYTAQYTYDANGNRTKVVRGATTITSSYDIQDRLLSSSNGVSYKYNRNGVLTTKIVSGQTTKFVFDALGGLKSVTKPGNQIISYQTDSQAKRATRVKNSVVQNYFFYKSPQQLAATLNADGTVNSRFVYATKNHVPDLLYKNGKIYRLITDVRGSVRLVVDSSAGTVAQKIDYDEFGRVTADTSPGFQPFAFAGGIYDADTKLVRFGAREYDAETGRWLSRDPILFAGGDANLYGYVLGDPVNAVDPGGLWGVQIGLGISGSYFFFGGGGELGIAITHSSNFGFQIGTYQGGQGRIGAGAGASASFNLSLTPGAQQLCDLASPSIGVSASLPGLSGGISFGSDGGVSYSTSIGTPTEFGIWGGGGYTSVNAW